jgi:acyl carrier protein
MNEKLIGIINTVLEGKGANKITSVNSGTHLRNDLGFDSFDLAELTVRIEEDFGVDVFSNGIVSTIGDIEKVLPNGKS